MNNSRNTVDIHQNEPERIARTLQIEPRQGSSNKQG